MHAHRVVSRLPIGTPFLKILYQVILINYFVSQEMSLSNYKLAAIFPVLLMMEVLIEDLAVLGLKDVCSITVRSFDVRNVKLFEKIIHFLISTIR